MAGMARQAAIVSASRFINQGLMVISPVILVRLLTVQDFGEYREFLMYATLVGNLAAFSLSSSLLYFVGLDPDCAWEYVRRIVIALAVTSTIAVGSFVLLDRLGPTSFMEDALWPCVLYILFYVNVDFWEFLWVAQKKPTLVFFYTAGRLALRIMVVSVAALLTRDVTVIVWTLVALEALRLMLSAIAWRRLAARKLSKRPMSGWREQIEFCVPSGIAVFVTTLNSSLGGIFIDQTLGASSLAQFAIAGYVIMIIFPLRNSISDVMLPEMAALASQGRNGWLPLWQRSVVLFSILLLPLAVLLWRYADLLIIAVFSDKYLDSVPVFRIYGFLLVLSALDVALILRAVNKTRAMLLVNFISIIVNLIAMYFLTPAYGIAGAAIALVLSSLSGLWFVLWRLTQMYGLSYRGLLPIRRCTHVLSAAAIAAVFIVPSFWTSYMGFSGVLIASVLYFLIFFFLLVRVFRVEEARWVLNLFSSRLPLRFGAPGK